MRLKYPHIFDTRLQHMAWGWRAHDRVTQWTERIYPDLLADTQPQQIITCRTFGEQSKPVETSLAIKFFKAGITRHRPMIDAQRFKVLDEHRFECEPFDSQLDDRSVGERGMPLPAAFRREASHGDQRGPCIVPLSDMPLESQTMEALASTIRRLTGQFRPDTGAVSANRRS